MLHTLGTDAGSRADQPEPGRASVSNGAKRMHKNRIKTTNE
jgi:hypothetical protein